MRYTAVERVEWGSLIGFALLFTLVIFVLLVLWRWLIMLLVLGPPAYAGIVAGHFTHVLTRDIGVAVLATVVVTGVLTNLARNVVRAVGRLLRPPPLCLEPRPVLRWRAMGFVCGIKRSTDGIQLVLKSRHLKFYGTDSE